MKKEIAFLDSTRKLVDAVADWLLKGHVREDASGAKSLDHVMVVVPTAQSGRQLRLKLARRAGERGWGGILPPRVVLPMHLVRPAAPEWAVATPVQLRAAFLKFVQTRPRRHEAGGAVVLDEWTHLFQGEYIADPAVHLSFLDQLNDIWRILAGGGRLMREVAQDEAAAEVLAAALGDEQARWEELASFEEAFFEDLHRLGLMHEVEAIHQAKVSAAAVDEGVEEVVLPALVDPVSVLYDVLEQQRDEVKVTVLVHADAQEADRFDAWGRPVVDAWTGNRRPVLDRLRAEDIVRTSTDAELAQVLAGDFPTADSGSARPALGLCDAELFPELSAAFLNVGYEVHNPERHRIAISSLGRILDNLLDLYAAQGKGCPWDAFVSLLREDDVAQILCGKDPLPSRSRVLEGIDICRNAFLPSVVPPDCAFDFAQVREWQAKTCGQFRAAAVDFLGKVNAALENGAGPATFLRRMLGTIYAGRKLGAGEGEKEFLAAAKSVRDILAQFEDAAVASLDLPRSAQLGLLRKTLSEASYSLEPDSRKALRTEGWLELVWSDADRIALAGFNEGAVPDSVMGHAFVPDSLRIALGLTSNVQRLARDTYLLSDILRSRADQVGAVRAYISLTNNAGDIRRPSRLLFLVAPGELAARTKQLFGELPAGKVRPPRKLAEAWRPRLPQGGVKLPRESEKFPDGRLSASYIDTWLKCPFTYLLKYGVGMERVKEKDELEADDFGTLVHKALELYALEQLERTKKGLAQLHEEEDIVASLARIMAKVRERFGERPSVKLRLQLDSAAERLKCFARIQAFWAQDGWVVKAQPEYPFTVRPFEGEEDCDVPVKGSVDRIDYKEGVGYRIVDYKTWDKRDAATGRILKGGAAHVALAERLRLPQVAGGEKSGPKRFLSVQLPLYARCLEKADPATFAGQVADMCYLLLGKSEEHVVVLGSAFPQGDFAAVKQGAVHLVELKDIALDTARAAIRRIRGNIFWPPGPDGSWKYDLKDVLMVSPEKDFPVGTAWRDLQEARLDELAVEHAAGNVAEEVEQ